MSTHHSFDTNIATKYGIQEAIIIHHFQHWIKINKRLKRNCKDGRTWSYQTIEVIAAQFPYLSKSQVFDALERLRLGKNRKSKKKKLDFEPVLIKGNYNKHKYDRTIWYAFAAEDEFIKMEDPIDHIGKSQNADCHFPTTIPDTKTDTKTNTTTPPTPSRGTAVGLKYPTKEEKCKMRIKGKALLTELHETISQHSRDPVVLDGIKLRTNCYWDGSKGVSINYALPQEEILDSIENIYGTERPYVAAFLKTYR